MIAFTNFMLAQFKPIWENVQKILSAYEVKNVNSLFERPFKVKKNGVFLFGMPFFVLEIFTFLYYANEASDDVIDRSTKLKR